LFIKKKPLKQQLHKKREDIKNIHSVGLNAAAHHVTTSFGKKILQLSAITTTTTTTLLPN
jgi:hypothetical protein